MIIPVMCGCQCGRWWYEENKELANAPGAHAVVAYNPQLLQCQQLKLQATMRFSRIHLEPRHKALDGVIYSRNTL